MTHREGKASNMVRVSVRSPVSAFGEMACAEPKAFAQLKFNNGLLVQKSISAASGSGTVTTAAAMLSVSSGTTTASVARLESRRAVRYAAGQGVEARFSFLFTAGVAGTTQLIGLGNAENALAIGMNGTALSVLRRFGGQVEIRTLTVTGAPDTDEDLTITLNGGAGVTVAILDADTIGEVAQKIASADYTAEGGGWRACYGGNKVAFLAITTEARGGAYTFGAGTTGATGSIAQTAVAKAASEEWVDQDAWNVDQMDGTNVLPANFNPTLGNVGRIIYQWLGFGMIAFELEDPSTGEWARIHEIRYANTATTPTLLQPDMALLVEASNKATTSAMVVQTACLGGFAYGPKVLTGPTFITTGNASVGTTELPLVAIRVKDVNLEGVTNTVATLLQLVNFKNESAKTAIYVGYINPTLEGPVTWADINATESTVEVSTNATGFSGGSAVITHITGAGEGGEHAFDETAVDTPLRAGDIFLVTGVVSTGAASPLGATITWVEDV